MGTVMVVFLLTFMCDLKSRRKIEELETKSKNSQTKIQDLEGLLEDTKREIAEKLKYEDQLNVFLTNLRSNEIGEIQKFTEQDVSTLTNDDAKTSFFRLLSLPLQSICKILKRIGGHWHVGGAGQATQVDGDKFVCMDQILAQDQCVIYSFGLAADWTFEDQMDLLGCKIFAYDHTINAPATRGQNIKYFKTGLGLGENLKPLSQLIAENEHQNTVIDYLKIDIEEYEFSEGGFQDWIKSGALVNVNQIALELHVLHKESNARQYIEHLQTVQDLYKLRFRVISHEPNMVVGPGTDGLYHFVEVVFMRETQL